jgi:hypothetical protein
LVIEALAKLIRFAENNFSLQLRVACIPVKEIYQANKELLVSKLEITKGKYIALFRGGGLEYADQLAKSSKQTFSIKNITKQSVSLNDFLVVGARFLRKKV